MDKIIEKIHIFSEAGIFLDKVSLIEVCKDFLIREGYRIVAPLSINTKVKTLQDLITYFYNKLLYKYPEYYNMSYDSVRDKKAASLFIRSRQKASGINRNQAVQECVLVIDTLFANEDLLGIDLKRTPNFSVFGQDKLGWITTKALSIVNSKIDALKADKKVALMAQYEEEALARLGNTGYSDDELDSILEKMEN